MKKFAAALAVLFVSMGAAPEGKPHIGIEIKTLDKATAIKTKCPVRTGVVVTDVEFGGSAYAAGIVAGDVISRIDHHQIGKANAISDWAVKATVGKTYKFTVYRQVDDNWEKLTPTVTVKSQSDKRDLADPAKQLFDELGKKPKVVDERNTFDVGGGKLKLNLHSPVVYLPAKGEKQLFTFLTHAYRDDHGRMQRDKEGFYSIGGKAEEISFTSDDPKLLDIKHDGTLGTILVAKEAGAANIVVTLAGTECKVPLKIERLEIDEGDESKAAVKAYGLPDKEEMHYTSWPKTETHDGIIYSPEAGQRIIAAKQWHYNKFPHLVVSIVDGKVYRIGSNDDTATRGFIGWMTGD